eukprot:NODE_85_length_3392_cov_189.070894_g76_i0.p1 GENE.NODE_85_length_3392_cov_189.070894_g76_i0~~NODE_85_length_3392_cov_189.070894_g76_i0.p1  ORF type:complete len:1061 (-),score=236.14 NODE_85_length_3392_cov_189.070894_g76_i0:161-3343(-)
MASFDALFETLVAGGQSDWDDKAQGKNTTKKAPKPKGKAAKNAADPVSPTSPTSPLSPTTPMTPTTVKERSNTANELANLVKSDQKMLPALFEKLKKASLQSSSSSRLGAMFCYKSVAALVGKPAEPYLVEALPDVLERMSDKVKNVQNAANDAAGAISGLLGPYAIKAALPGIIAGLQSSKGTQTKIGSLNLLISLSGPDGQVGPNLPELVPIVSEVMWDIKPEVKALATDAMGKACMAVGNPDVEPFIPVLVKAIANPEEVPECVYKLAATTFVQAVESPALAIMVPLLVRALKERSTPIKRQAAIIIDNMAKLVYEPKEALIFLDKLFPGLENVVDVVSDPECRNVATRTLETLNRIKDQAAAVVSKDTESPEAVVKSAMGGAPEAVVTFITNVVRQLHASKVFDGETWSKVLCPYLTNYVNAKEAEALSQQFFKKCGPTALEEEEEEEDEEGEDLCNSEFSLAYGSKILLNTAKLHLKRGRRYGLCGGNDVGKSTLMRSIAGGQLEGFPDADTLRSVYVEPDIPAALADLSVIEFVFADPKLAHESRDEVTRVLKSVDFSDEMIVGPVTALSGGWRMKLALSRAMLAKADILMLDEPTNHLDVKNVAWLQKYLISLDRVTTIAVSHDSRFLDEVCTDIIHFENKKLRRYKGNLSHFVKLKPEAKSYYELSSSKLVFKFPEPGYLEGVKSRSKVILKASGVGFTYPGTKRKILTGATVWCSLSSRVAVLGANGAGKTTFIRILTGELIPDEGEVTRHPNMRFAYVAQHAFHHLEDHVEKTPNEYIQWRFAGGEDKENLDKAARQATPEEEKKMAEKILYDGEKRQIEKVLARRQLKKSYEYEVKWVGKPHDDNSWLPRSKLEECGWLKILQKIDERDAAQHNQLARPLTQQAIVKHLEDVGLEAEYSVHTQIRALSGGQKVKVVIAAAMWSNPHILVMDEPTNYLDRDSLGALAGAIKEFGGGVLMISHHSEFTDALCQERWFVADGKCVPENQPPEFAVGSEKLEWKPEEETVDASGNTVKVEQKKTQLSRKERMAREKNRKARLARGEEVSSDED